MELVNLEFYEKELNQSYKKMEFTKTEKGKVSQSIGNLVIALMNPNLSPFGADSLRNGIAICFNKKEFGQQPKQACS